MYVLYCLQAVRVEAFSVWWSQLRQVDLALQLNSVAIFSLKQMFDISEMLTVGQSDEIFWSD